MNINEITMGMTAQEKEIYFAHQEKRHREEAIKVQYEREQMMAYKESLIKDIMRYHPDKWTEEELKKKSIRVLEMIF